MRLPTLESSLQSRRFRTALIEAQSPVGHLNGSRHVMKPEAVFITSA